MGCGLDCEASKRWPGALHGIVGGRVSVAVSASVLGKMLQREQGKLNHPGKCFGRLLPRNDGLARPDAKRHSEAVLREPIALPPLGEFGADHRAPPMSRNWTSNSWTFRGGSIIAASQKCRENVVRHSDNAATK